MLKSDTEILSIKGLSLTVKKGTVILDGIHFSLRAGEKLAVIGPNGSGKSSLLRAIIGEVNPDKGALYWQGGHYGNCRHKRARGILPSCRKTISPICA